MNILLFMDWNHHYINQSQAILGIGWPWAISQNESPLSIPLEIIIWTTILVNIGDHWPAGVNHDPQPPWHLGSPSMAEGSSSTRGQRGSVAVRRCSCGDFWVGKGWLVEWLGSLSWGGWMWLVNVGSWLIVKCTDGTDEWSWMMIHHVMMSIAIN